MILAASNSLQNWTGTLSSNSSHSNLFDNWVPVYYPAWLFFANSGSSRVNLVNFLVKYWIFIFMVETVSWYINALSQRFVLNDDIWCLLCIFHDFIMAVPCVMHLPSAPYYAEWMVTCLFKVFTIIMIQIYYLKKHRILLCIFTGNTSVKYAISTHWNDLKHIL